MMDGEHIGLEALDAWLYGFIGQNDPPSEGVTTRELLEAAFHFFLEGLEASGDPIAKMSADELYALARQKVPPA